MRYIFLIEIKLWKNINVTISVNKKRHFVFAVLIKKKNENFIKKIRSYKIRSYKIRDNM